jgi:flagellar protein FliL
MKKPIKWMLSIIVGMVVIVGLAVGVYEMFVKPHKHSGPVHLTSAQQAALQYAIPEMTTNLKGSGVVQFTVTLQASDKSTLAELKELTPSIEDALNETMREFTMQDLTTSTGLTRLKSQIESSVNERLPQGKVTNVLLPTVVAQ